MRSKTGSATRNVTFLLLLLALVAGARSAVASSSLPDDALSLSKDQKQPAARLRPPADEPLTSGIPKAGSITSQGAVVNYTIAVPSGAAALDVVLDGPAGADFDLYVRRGQRPTTGRYDERGYTPSADETVRIDNPAGGTYYIMVHGFQGAGKFRLTATVTAGGQAETLTSGVSKGGSITSQGARVYFTIAVPSGAATLDVVLDGPAGADFDLYVRRGQPPTTGQYDKRGYTSSADEAVRIDNPVAGTYHIMVHGYQGAGNFRLTATVTAGGQAAALTSGETVSDSLGAAGSRREYQILVPGGAQSMKVEFLGIQGTRFNLEIDGDEESVAGSEIFLSYDPEPGAHTIGVSSPENNVSYELTVTIATDSGSGEVTCDAAGDCTTVLYMIMPETHFIGAQFGSRAIIQFNIAGPGRIEARATWLGTATQMALILNGPDRPHLPNPVAYYERRDGSSGISISYNVTQEDFARGRQWRVSLVNFSGGTASAQINVTYPGQPGETGAVETFNFWREAASASWRNDQGVRLPFPGAGNDRRGFARTFGSARLEDGRIYDRVLQMHPRWTANGNISGAYQVTVPANGRFKAQVGFLQGAGGSDGVTFGVSFALKPTPGTLSLVTSVGQKFARYDNRLDTVDFDLSSWAGKEGTIWLYVDAGASSGQDWAVWVDPRIEGTQAGRSPTTAPFTLPPHRSTTNEYALER